MKANGFGIVGRGGGGAARPIAYHPQRRTKGAPRAPGKKSFTQKLEERLRASKAPGKKPDTK